MNCDDYKYIINIHIFYMYLISLTYDRDIQIMKIFNIFGPIEYTIKYVDEFDIYLGKHIKYYKIYWNYFSILPFFRNFLMKTDNQIVCTGIDKELVSNYFLSYEAAKKFLYKTRDCTKFILNENEHF